jgi:hypothetical protein
MRLSACSTHPTVMARPAEHGPIRTSPLPQEFEKRIASSIRLTDLAEAEPLGWCGLTKVQVWGKDVYAPPSRVASLRSIRDGRALIE